jgi:N utilization substance protein A
MKSDFLIAVTQLAAERNLPREAVISAVEAALVSAYKKDPAAAGQNIAVRLNPGTGDVAIFQLKTIVEEVADSSTELTVKEARKLQGKDSVAELGDVLEFEMQPQAAGRIAAQTAKQVVIQRLREAERELVYAEFSEREGEVFTGTVQRGDARQGGSVTLDLNGRAEAVLPPPEQAAYDRYRPGQKMKVLVLEVLRTTRGPEIVVSRAHPDLLRRLFEMEVPEIFNGVVEIKGIAREAGFRSKVAVTANQEGVDPVGACVGLRGIRIQNIVNELQGEKIDVVQWSKDPSVFISHSLSPAQPMRVELDPEEATATVVVSDRQLSLAIGKEGQNARLAAKLTGWKVDIKSSTELEIERMKQVIETQVAEQASQGPTSEAPVTETEAPVAEAEPEPAVAEVAAPVEVAEVEVAEGPEVAVEPVAAEQVAAVEPDISPEEKLALESLDLAVPAAGPAQIEEVTEAPDGEEEEEEEEGALFINEDELWKMPEPAGGGPQIRFAEDILGPTGQRSDGGKRRRKRARVPRGASRGPKPGGPAQGPR